MKKALSVLITLISMSLCLQFGCSTNSASLLNENKRRQENANLTSSYDASSSMVDEQNGSDYLDFFARDKGEIIQTQSCKIKYHKRYSKDRNIVVEGTIGITGEKYPIVLDTGASQAIFLNSIHVKKNKLPACSIKDSNLEFNGYTLGFCQLNELEIGNITLKNWNSLFLESQTTLNFLGIPIASSTSSQDSIILGLPLLQEFKYMIFDNINKKVELSYNESFKLSEPDRWEQYPISIEEDFHGNTFLFVRFSIAGQEVELQLDTGSGRGLAINERLWDKIRTGLEGVKLKKGKDFYPYIGNLRCRKGVVSELEFGNRIIHNAEISIFNNDNSLLDECEGLVGMQYFLNTVIVLDFEHELMWFRKS